MMNCCIERKRAREESAHKQQNVDDFESGMNNLLIFYFKWSLIIENNRELIMLN